MNKQYDIVLVMWLVVWCAGLVLAAGFDIYRTRVVLYKHRTTMFSYPQGDALSLQHDGIEYTTSDALGSRTIMVPGNAKRFTATDSYMVFDLGSDNYWIISRVNTNLYFADTKSFRALAQKLNIPYRLKFDPVRFPSLDVLKGYGVEHEAQ